MTVSKTYVIYYVWQNTARNHAGMAYLVKQLKVAYPGEICLIKVPSHWNSWTPILKKAWHLLIIIYLKIFVGKKDRILFMEFLGNRSGDQTDLAKKLRNYGVKNRILGLVHLSQSNLAELYGDESYIVKSLSFVDKVLIFGTSLEEYFSKLGFKDKVRKTYHYVDTKYYCPIENGKENNRLKVICIGSLKRNHELLGEIIGNCPFADFKICMGLNDKSEVFKNINNISLHRYLEEDELLKLMQQSDVSLSVLHDTVGSNVIVTSMATGLVNLVSDVGSIRDYCSENDSILCKDKSDFINALNKLSSNKDLLKELSGKSVVKAKEFDLQRFIRGFPELVS